MTGSENQSSTKAAFTTALIVLWAVVIVTPLSLMMTSHMVPLPSPKEPKTTADLQSPTFSALASALTNAKVGSGWKVIHILVAGCPCSKFTAQSLVARKPLPECQEVVFILGGEPDWKQSLVQSGFNVHSKDAEQLAKDTGISGGPWLLVISPEGKIAYSGGYAGQRPRPGIVLEDVNILHAAFAGKVVPEYPAYGCAATPLRAGKLDPIGICQNIQ